MCGGSRDILLAAFFAPSSGVLEPFFSEPRASQKWGKAPSWHQLEVQTGYSWAGETLDLSFKARLLPDQAAGIMGCRSLAALSGHFSH